MDVNILRKIGLTEGEIKVYDALLKLGKSSTGPIMEKAGISSSKVYLILDKLIQKGLVSFILENNVKMFAITNPKNILYYLEKQEKEIEEIKKDARGMIIDIAKILGKYEEESVQIYKGLAGVRAAYQNTTDELNKGDELLIFTLTDYEFTEKVKTLFDNMHAERVSKGVKAKAISDIKFRKFFLNATRGRKFYERKFSRLTLPSSMSISKTRTIILLLEENPIAIEIVSKRMADRYREFFYKMWEKAEK